MTTLCGQVLADGTYAGTDAVADCANCIRRSRDQSRISSAFFEQDEGSELLRLSLEHARQRRPERRVGEARPEDRKPHLRVVPSSTPASVPDEVGELVTDGFKSSSQGVWRSPGGVVVRMAGPGRERFAELVFEGSVIVRREGERFVIRAGDVEVRQAGDGVQVRIRRQ